MATITPPTLEPVEEEIETETELVGEDGERRVAPRPTRRPRAPRATRRLSRPPATPARRVLSRTPVDWLVVGLGNPGPGYADTPHNVGFKVADELVRRWDLPKPQEEVRRRADRGPHRPGRPARGAAQAADVHERRRAARSGPARGAYRLELDRVLVLHDEIDLPFGDVRVAARRRAGRPQRPEVLEARARRRRTSAACASASGRPDSTDPDIVAAYVLGRWRQPAGEVAELVGRAADEAERVVLA